ncbi:MULTISPECIES: hypothetical protein [unclassified Streptomyces]|uniref:hypothetical protein n=1 Tax=unclassified Streptomyces TaxID=2593676 RepID=UPI003794F52C
MHLDLGRVDEAVTWYRQAADCGYPLALPRTVRLLHTAGRLDESLRLRRFGGEPDGSIAGPWQVRAVEEASERTAAVAGHVRRLVRDPVTY